jgi:hypothetical protein
MFTWTDVRFNSTLYRQIIYSSLREDQIVYRYMMSVIRQRPCLAYLGKAIRTRDYGLIYIHGAGT